MLGVGDDHIRMDVTLSADGHRVAEPPRHLADSTRELPLEIAALPRGRLRGQGESGEDGASPRSEILGREVVAPDLPQVRIDVGRVYRLTLSLVVQVLEKLVPRQLLTLADHAGEPPVRDADDVVLAALAPELEAKSRAFEFRGKGGKHHVV